MPLAQGFDLLWLRLPKADSDPPRAYGLYPRAGSILVVSDRMRVWQLGLGVPKGTYQRLRQAGLVALRARIAEMAPWVVDRLDLIESWNQLSLLVVAAGRVGRWHRPGLLLIGDAAHVMSPVFGVGINYAIQDAIVAAKVLGPRLLAGDVRSRDLARVQRRRQWPTRVMQWMQTFGEHQSAEQPPSGRKRLEGRLLEAAAHDVPAVAADCVRRVGAGAATSRGVRYEVEGRAGGHERFARHAGVEVGSRPLSAAGRLPSASSSVSRSARECTRPPCDGR